MYFTGAQWISKVRNCDQLMRHHLRAQVIQDLSSCRSSLSENAICMNLFILTGISKSNPCWKHASVRYLLAAVQKKRQFRSPIQQCPCQCIRHHWHPKDLSLYHFNINNIIACKSMTVCTEALIRCFKRLINQHSQQCIYYHWHLQDSSIPKKPLKGYTFQQ